MASQLSPLRRPALVGFALLGAIGLLGAPDGRTDDLDPVLAALQHAARLPVPSAPIFKFPATVSPDQPSLARMQSIFERFFPEKLDLIPLLRKIVIESAVAEIPGEGRLLYNPTHSLFLYLLDSHGSGHDISVSISTLTEVSEILKEPLQTGQPLSGYTQGFDLFRKLSALMLDPVSRDTLQVIWSEAPRSENEKERIRHLLLQPVQQATTIAAETAGCKQTIDRLVDDTRAGKRAQIRLLPGLTNNLRPTNFMRFKDKLILVLSEALIARYYVIAEFQLNASGCSLLWEEPLFVI